MPDAISRNESRDQRRLPAGAVLGSVLLHSVAGLVLFVAGTSIAALPPPPQTYRVRLVAAAPETAPVRLEPEPARVAEEEERPPPPQPTPEPLPEAELPTVVEEQPQPNLPSREPARAEEVGEEAVNVQLEGATFPYPQYLQNIIRQVHRYWRPPTGGRSLQAELVFVIEEDGSVSEVEWVRRSGDLTFDLEARGAVEAAGRAKAFGPLPDGFPADRLRVSFFFDPSTL